MPSEGLLSPVWAGSAVAAETTDHAWLRAMLETEAALARAQARLGVVPAAAAARITRAAAELRPDPADLAVRARGIGNPVLALLGELRTAVGPDFAPYVHHGCTSQDVVDTATMLVCARAVRHIGADLDATLAGLADVAERHRDTPMAARTLGMRALPTTFGLVAAGWLAGVLEAREKLAALAFPVQLGGAAGTMAGYGEHALALPRLVIDELAHPTSFGLPSEPAAMGPMDVPVRREVPEPDSEVPPLSEPVLPWHTRRTPVTDLGYALGTTAAALGKAATDVVLLAQSEVGEVAEPAAAGRGGSSALAHKRNPVLAVLIRSAALQTPAQVSVLMAAYGGAAQQRPAGEWHAEWQPLRECLRLAGGAAATAAELFSGLEVFPDRMRVSLDELAKQLTDTSTEMRPPPTAGALVDRVLERYRSSSP